jgi:hypothetical protein
VELITMKLNRSAVASTSSTTLIDAVMDGYVAWREETGTVETAYRNWLRVDRQDRDLAFAAYCAALDREEYAAAEYERLIAAATT